MGAWTWWGGWAEIRAVSCSTAHWTASRQLSCFESTCNNKMLHSRNGAQHAPQVLDTRDERHERGQRLICP